SPPGLKGCTAGADAESKGALNPVHRKSTSCLDIGTRCLFSSARSLPPPSAPRYTHPRPGCRRRCPMLSLHDQPSRLCDGVSRREWLRVGGLSALGLSLPALLEARHAGPDLGRTFGRAKNVLFLWLQ